MTLAVAFDRKALWRDINREERKKKRALMLELRTEVREARARRKQALFEAKERCRSERLAARERARSLRAKALLDLREAVQLERASARQTCSVRLGEARAIKDDIERARAKVAAEKQYRRELRRIEAANRQRRREHLHATYIERRAESDDEVRMNISQDLVPLFERVKRGIKATQRMSRTEAFLKYAEEHPDEVLGDIEDKSEALIRARERAEKQTVRAHHRLLTTNTSEVPF
ncbi:MAG: hypothetical protein ACRELY_03820 [Polyangiaceae bacterium]